MAKILIADGDNALTSEIEQIFTPEGFDVEVAPEAHVASTRIFQRCHDVIVLDLALEGLDGFDICHRFRETGGTAAILATSDRHTVEYAEQIISVGADDYLVKPFHARELLTRTKAVLRKSPANNQIAEILRFADIEIDTMSGTVRKNGQQIHLFPMELNLLEFLIRHQNQSFSSNALCQRVWKDKHLQSSDTVRTHIRTLRRKIDTPGQASLIKTEHRRGYRLVEPDAQSHAVIVPVSEIIEMPPNLQIPPADFESQHP